MIKAKFIKATPIEGGITYILKGERTKDALRAAVDLDNEDCIIELDVRKSDSEPDHDDPLNTFIIQNTADYARNLREALRIMSEVKDNPVVKKSFTTETDDFPATLVERFDKQIEDGKPFMGSLENSCKTNK